MPLEKNYLLPNLVLTVLAGQLILTSLVAAATKGSETVPPRLVASAANGAVFGPSAEVSLHSGEPKGGPCCEQVCAQGCATSESARAVLRDGRFSDAVESLRGCQGDCPQVVCQLTLLYYDTEPTALKERVDNKQIRKDSRQCRDLVNPAKVMPSGPCAGATSDKTRTAVNAVWRMSHRPLWAGYGLLAAGIALTLTSSTLMVLAARNRLPLPGDCGWQTGVSGDPCGADFANPGTQAALGIPLAAGLGGLAAGAALILKY